MLTDLALGWSGPGPLPDGVAAVPLGTLRLLTAPATAPEQVLALQQACFDAGLTLLPISPASLCPVDRALTQPLAPLQDRLKALEGQAQIALHLGWQLPPPPSDGRAWLADRRARAQAESDARQWLVTLAQRLDLRASPATSRPGAALIHLLAPRDALPGLDHLARLTADLPDPAPDCRLTLTGPWPPHAFAHLPEAA